jgi:hypothetical protein
VTKRPEEGRARRRPRRRIRTAAGGRRWQALSSPRSSTSRRLGFAPDATGRYNTLRRPVSSVSGVVTVSNSRLATLTGWSLRNPEVPVGTFSHLRVPVSAGSGGVSTSNTLLASLTAPGVCLRKPAEAASGERQLAAGGGRSRNVEDGWVWREGVTAASGASGAAGKGPAPRQGGPGTCSRFSSSERPGCISPATPSIPYPAYYADRGGKRACSRPVEALSRRNRGDCV